MSITPSLPIRLQPIPIRPNNYAGALKGDAGF